MKRCAPLMIATACVALYSSQGSSHPCSLACPIGTQAPDGLIAHYPFDGDANDVSGNGYHAVVETGTSVVEGRIGNAYYFSGRGSFVLLPLDLSPDVYPQLTITG